MTPGTFRRVLFFLVTAQYLIICTKAAHARKRPTVVVPVRSNPYDKQITTFNEEGHLLQVQYAKEAASKGSRGLFMTHRGFIIAVVEHKNGSVGLTSSSGNNGIYRIHDGIMAKMTGLSGDARMLAKYLMSTCHNIAWRNGHGSGQFMIRRESVSLSADNNNDREMNPPVVKVPIRLVADECAQVQHSITIRPGARPLGVQAILFGVDDTDDDSNSSQKLSLYLCNLSGTFHECYFCTCGGDMTKYLMDLENIFESCSKEGSSTDGRGSDETQSLDDVIIKMADILMKEISSSSLPVLDNNEDTDQPALVDIYVMKLNARRRGGVQISFASSVKKDDLKMVGKLFVDEMQMTV